jgi:hypothetical protein
VTGVGKGQIQRWTGLPRIVYQPPATVRLAGSSPVRVFYVVPAGDTVGPGRRDALLRWCADLFWSKHCWRAGIGGGGSLTVTDPGPVHQHDGRVRGAGECADGSIRPAAAVLGLGD